MNIWDYNLRHLAAIAQIAALGTMGAAARAVNLTQPALTQALARVESQLNLPLFERRHDGMVPTPAADLLVPRIRAALNHAISPHVTTARMRALLALADSAVIPAQPSPPALRFPRCTARSRTCHSACARHWSNGAAVRLC